MPESLGPEIRLDILDTLQMAVVGLSLDGRIVYWNDGAERITGYLRHEVMGHVCTENFLRHCDQRSCELCGESCPRAQAKNTSRTIQSRNAIHNKSGERVAVHSWLVPVRNQHGIPIAIAFNFEGSGAASEPERREDGLESFGLRDGSTGLANHEMMRARLREALNTFNELHVPFAVLRARLIGLEQMRTSHGQAAVSAMFPAAARTLESAIRPGDCVGRWADDEFLVVMNNCSTDSLQHVVERVRSMVRRAAIEFWGEELGIPVGIAVASAQAGDTPESLLARASASALQEAEAAKTRVAAAAAEGSETAAKG